MSRVSDVYNGELVWRVRKHPERTPTPQQRLQLPMLEQLVGETDEFQYVAHYNKTVRDDLPVNISTFVTMWDYLYGMLQKLHDCRIVHGYLSSDSIVFTDYNAVVFVDFYGSPHIPFSEEAVHQDKLDLLDAMRFFFACGRPQNRPLNTFVDEFEKMDCDSTRMHEVFKRNKSLANCTFIERLDDRSYECSFSSSKLRCIVKFTNTIEVLAYKALENTRVCPTLVFSSENDDCFGPYVCYAKIPHIGSFSVDLDTAIQAFQLLAKMHSNRIAHLNIRPENLVCQRMYANDRKRLTFVDFSFSRSVMTPKSEICTAIHSIELRQNPMRACFEKSDDVFALAVLLLCTITGIKTSQVEACLSSGKSANKLYNDLRVLFEHECDDNPMFRVLLQAVVPHEQRPNAPTLVSKLEAIKPVN